MKKKLLMLMLGCSMTALLFGCGKSTEETTSPVVEKETAVVKETDQDLGEKENEIEGSNTDFSVQSDKSEEQDTNPIDISKQPEVIAFENDEPVSVCDDKIICYYETVDDMQYLVINDTKLELEYRDYDDENNTNYAIIFDDSRYLLLCSFAEPNDYHGVVPVWVENGTPVQEPDLPGYLDETTIKADSVVLHSQSYVFGTYEDSITYQLKFGEALAPADGYYVMLDNEPVVNDGSYYSLYDPEIIDFTSKVYDENGRHILTLKTDIIAYSENGQQTLPAGSKLYPMGYYPEEGHYCVELEDGSHVYFNFEADPETYGHYVDGISEEQVFEAILYAG